VLVSAVPNNISQDIKTKYLCRVFVFPRGSLSHRPCHRLPVRLRSTAHRFCMRVPNTIRHKLEIQLQSKDSFTERVAQFLAHLESKHGRHRLCTSQTCLTAWFGRNKSQSAASVCSRPDEMPSTVIIGAGIIGCSTAYYLSENATGSNNAIHLVENSPELFASASGKSGGFLAADCRFTVQKFPSRPC